MSYLLFALGCVLLMAGGGFLWFARKFWHLSKVEAGPCQTPDGFADGGSLMLIYIYTKYHISKKAAIITR